MMLYVDPDFAMYFFNVHIVIKEYVYDIIVALVFVSFTVVSISLWL